MPIEAKISTEEHVQDERAAYALLPCTASGTFALVISGAENKPGILEERDQGERPNNTARGPDHVLPGRRRIVGENAETYQRIVSDGFG